MVIAFYEVLCIVTTFQDTLGKDIEQLPPLLEAYHLRDKFEEGTATYLTSHGFTKNSHFTEDKEVTDWILLFVQICYNILQSFNLFIHNMLLK